MSNYVTSLISDDISSLNVAGRLSDMSNSYNLAILEAIGDGPGHSLPRFDDQYFKSHCDSLRISYGTAQASNLADSVMYSYAAYMLTSLEFDSVMQSDFIDSRTWYFDRLQPRFDRLRDDIDKLNDVIFRGLEKDSATFERGFYRSIIPSTVAVCVGLLLVIMLIFFLLSLYVDPLYKMLASLSAYRSRDKQYRVHIDSGDELSELNEGISELCRENQQLRSRLKTIKRD